MLTVRLKVKKSSHAWLNAAAIEVNQVWNWANEVSANAADRNLRAEAKWLSGFDLTGLAAGASKHFGTIKSNIINSVCLEYAIKRRVAKKRSLKWRTSFGSRRSLGWVPFKASDLKRTETGVRLLGKSFRLFNRQRLPDSKLSDGRFSQDACGDWWLCVPFHEIVEPIEAGGPVGIDLGCKDAAVTSDGDRLASGAFRAIEARISAAQRRGHRKQAKKLHRKAANRRKDTMHKFSTMLVRRYGQIFVGDVSSSKLVRTRMAKSVLDAGWGMLKNQLEYKCQKAARRFEVIDERNTTRGCSECGSLTGPQGLRDLAVRTWTCSDCGAEHDRDINAARNILVRAKPLASICGNELFIAWMPTLALGGIASS